MLIIINLFKNLNFFWIIKSSNKADNKIMVFTLEIKKKKFSFENFFQYQAPQ